MGAKPAKTEVLQLQDGRQIKVKYKEGAGLGFTPWPGSFALAKFLDVHRERLRLSQRRALELGSGACSVSGLTAGLLCKQADLTDRLEVLQDLDASISFAFGHLEPMPNALAKVLDWQDMEFTESAFRPGQADLLLMSDVVYFPMLMKPLLNTLLLLSTASTEILWANCDQYPSYVPDLEPFLEMLGRFFEITVEEERSQLGCGGPCEVPEGRVTVRSLRLAHVDLAREEVKRAKAGNPAEACIKRCLF
eukprot:TRINITY_DN42809_c0_g1_i1.p1 TRINITY_DN42809_c0_g1~~TRINITY_DN42809_c0_g1_i1.p1  ORF type:complete len:249 (+),score=60.56 TRINITY_DN42809_c0_g1_i1:91-837(+)